jgi:hypothetical protein
MSCVAIGDACIAVIVGRLWPSFRQQEDGSDMATTSR